MVLMCTIPCSDVNNVSHFVGGSLILCFLKILSTAFIRKNGSGSRRVLFRCTAIDH